MSDISDSELFSAYLDGEVTAEEQVRAEQMLALSAEARQLLEELRAVSGTLQGLPQQKLDEDLTARVLQVAERRMLAPEETDKPEAADKPAAGRAAATLTKPDDASGGFPWREISWRGMFSPRALVWSALIVVVAVLIHFNAPPQKANPGLARSDEKKSAGAPLAVDRGTELSVGDKKGTKSRPEPAWVGPADKPGDLDRKETAKNGKDGEMVAKAEDRLSTVREKGKAVAGELKRDGSEIRAGGGAPGAPARGSRVEEGRGGFGGEALPHGKIAEEPRRERTMGKSAGGAVVAKDGAGGFGGGGERHEQRLLVKAGPGMESPAVNGPLPEAAMPPMSAAAPTAAPAPPAVPVAPAPLSRKAAAAQSVDNAKHAEEPATIVQVNCSSEAMRKGLFKDLLRRNGVAARELANDGRLAVNGGQRLFLQSQNATTFNGNLAAGAVQIPIANSVPSDSTKGQQQIAQDETNQAQNVTVQNGSTSAAPHLLKAQPRAQYAPQGGAAQPSGNLDSANGIQSAGTLGAANSYRFSGPAQITANASKPGGPQGSGAAWYYFECDATPDQLAAVKKQIRERRDAFSLPEDVATATESLADDARDPRAGAPGGRQELYDFQTANGTATQNGPAKGALAKQFRAEAQSNPAATDKLKEQAAKRPAAKGSGGALRSPPPPAPQLAAAAKTRVVFALHVDRVAPPPAAAAAAPAAPSQAPPPPAAKGK